MDNRPSFQTALEEERREESSSLGRWLWPLFVIAVLAVKFGLPLAAAWVQRMTP